MIEKQEMSPEKTDVAYPKEGTAEKMQRVLQLAVMIEYMAGQKQKGKEEAASKSKGWKKSDAQGREKRKHSKQKSKGDILLRKSHPGIFQPANPDNQRHNREKPLK